MKSRKNKKTKYKKKITKNNIKKAGANSEIQYSNKRNQDTAIILTLEKYLSYNTLKALLDQKKKLEQMLILI